jgi:hypothetical protein
MRSPLTLSTRPAAASLACLLVLALAGGAGDAQAQWKWRDKSGQINASDRPPPLDVPDKDILGRPTDNQRRAAPAASASASAPAAAASGPALGPLDRELQARQRNAEQEQAAKAKADAERLAAQRGENCRAARGHLAALETGQRIARMNDKGEREVLDDKGRAEEQRRARAVIASDCR